MFSNLQINRTLVKIKGGMNDSGNTVSQQAMLDEWQEIQAAQQDPRMFRPLYNRYYEPIFRFILRRTGSENTSADICSQVFLKALQKITKYQFKGVPFSAWLYRIASNEVAQHFRNDQKNRVVSIDKTNLSDLIEEVNEDNEEVFRTALTQTLNQLKPDDLQLIEMRFFEKRPFKEIANILGLTESNTKVKTYRILEKMRKTIIAIKDQQSNA